jgi:hypothetical protein
LFPATWCGTVSNGLPAPRGKNILLVCLSIHDKGTLPPYITIELLNRRETWVPDGGVLGRKSRRIDIVCSNKKCDNRIKDRDLFCNRYLGALIIHKI